MNVIEKINLVQEINQILLALDSQRISFFEIAKSRQRLKEIYKLCDEPIFHQQKLALQALTLPKALALEFAKKSPFYECYQGFFIRENALKTQIISGWALLQNAMQQWQAWLIFSDEAYVASSPWYKELNDVLPWLEQQYQQRDADATQEKTSYLTEDVLTIPPTVLHAEKTLNTMLYTQQEGAPLTRRVAYQIHPTMGIESRLVSRENSASSVDLGQNLVPTIAVAENQDHSLVAAVAVEQATQKTPPVQHQLIEAEQDKNVDDDVEVLSLNLGQPIFHSRIAAQIQARNTTLEQAAQPSIDLGEVQPAIALNVGSSLLASVQQQSQYIDVATMNVQTKAETLLHPQAQDESVTEDLQHDLQQIHVAQYKGRLQRLSSAFTDEPHTYALHFEQTPPTDYLELLVYSETEQDLSHLPIYIAEQVNLQERLSQYVVLFGAVTLPHALKIIQDYVTHTSHRLQAVRKVDWHTFHESFLQLESFTQMYLEQERIVWKKEDYLPYMPVELIHVIKMLPFEETIAQASTPILLLRDRLKLRLVHGKNRLNLSKNESAYPTLILDRKDGASWQLVKTALSELPKPVNVYQLYEKIQALVRLELSV